MEDADWSDVERLFHAAMDRPYDQRREYVEDVASTDSQREAVLKLIDAAEQADDFMQTSMGLEAFSPSLIVGERKKPEILR